MAEALKSMFGEKPKGDAARPGMFDPDDESDGDGDEEEEGPEIGPQRAGKAKMSSENEDKGEESRQGLERAQSLLGGWAQTGRSGHPSCRACSRISSR